MRTISFLRLNSGKDKELVTSKSITRRGFILTAVAATTATALLADTHGKLSVPTKRYKALAFDAFAIFNPTPVLALAEIIFPEKGRELGATWRAKQFEYCWLRTAGRQYKNFWQITEDALLFAARKTGVELTSDAKRQLMEQYLKLSIWSDVLPVLQNLGQSGIRLSLLSNMTPGMLEANIKHSNLENYFDEVISTDLVKDYKPCPLSYQLGVEKLKLNKEDILFVAFAGWDAVGSKWFGYPTFWLNRLGLPMEELNTTPDGSGKSMDDLLNFIKH